jgi:uncharacterized protein YjiS (DUF1127 family)
MNGFIPTNQVQHIAAHAQPSQEQIMAAVQQIAREEILRVKQSEAAVVERVQHAESIRQEAVHYGMSKISAIVEVAKAETLLANNINPGDHYLQNRDQYLALAKMSEEELADEMADGALAEAAMESDMLQAAIEDPELAAEIISEETGTPVSAEEVESAVKALATAAVSEEMGEPADLDVKVSSSIGFYHQQGWVKSAAVLAGAADLRAALAIQHIVEQQMGRRY